MNSTMPSVCAQEPSIGPARRSTGVATPERDGAGHPAPSTTGTPPELVQLARLLGRQAARQHMRRRSRGLGHIWVVVWLLIISGLLTAVLRFLG